MPFAHQKTSTIRIHTMQLLGLAGHRFLFAGTLLTNLTSAPVTVSAPVAHFQALEPHGCVIARSLALRFRPGAVVLVGEMHGTRESPAFLAATACGVAGRQQK